MRENLPPEDDPEVHQATLALVEALHRNGRATYQVSVTMNIDESGKIIDAQIGVASTGIETLEDAEEPDAEGLSGVFILCSEAESTVD